MKLNKYNQFIQSLNHVKLMESFEWTPEDILMEISLPLQDKGLKVRVKNDSKFDWKFYLEIDDTDKIFCKNYPEDDMDWLWGKPVINEFIQDLEDFGLQRDVYFKIYAGGTGVNVVFDDPTIIKL